MWTEKWVDWLIAKHVAAGRLQGAAGRTVVIFNCSKSCGKCAKRGR